MSRVAQLDAAAGARRAPRASPAPSVAGGLAPRRRPAISDRVDCQLTPTGTARRRASPAARRRPTPPRTQAAWKPASGRVSSSSRSTRPRDVHGDRRRRRPSPVSSSPSHGADHPGGDAQRTRTSRRGERRGRRTSHAGPNRSTSRAAGRHGRAPPARSQRSAARARRRAAPAARATPAAGRRRGADAADQREDERNGDRAQPRDRPRCGRHRDWATQAACRSAYTPSARPARRAGRAATTHARVEDEHLVGGLGGRQPVGDRERRAPAGQRVQGPLQPHLGRRVDGAGRLVEHEQVGVGEVGPGQRDELPLPRRQRLAALADRGARGRPAAPSSQSARPSSVEAPARRRRRSRPGRP